MARRILPVLATIALGVIWGSGVRLRAQPPDIVWQFESVAASASNGCVRGATLGGFEYGADGRPVLLWREENGCGGTPRVFWTRKEGGAWNIREFDSENRTAGGAKADFFHRLVLRPSDGNPFLIRRDVDPFNNINTYRTDLGAYPTGGGSDFIEALAGPQNGVGAEYALAFAPGAALPDWATGLANGNLGAVRLNGFGVGSGYQPHPALAITPDGVRHVLWNTGNFLYYARQGPTDALPTAFASPLFTNINLNGGEVRLASDASGTLHAVVRGVEGDQADYDNGAVVYLSSRDGGATWTPFEYVDPNDAVPGSIGQSSDISLGLDADGTPAVTYWRYKSELWYARRDGPGGTWTRSLVTIESDQFAPRAAQVRFDVPGHPVIAFYDSASQTVQLAMPTPPACSPFAQNDTATTVQDAAVTIPVLDNDIVPVACAGAALSMASVTQPQHGAVTFDTKLATVTYTPSPGFSGIDTFTYTVALTGNTATATVTILVQPPPSAPIRNGAPETNTQFDGVGMILPGATHVGCNATVIARSIVLTTAQCLHDLSGNATFEFSLGSGRTARLTDIRLHPQAYSIDGFDQGFDVAVARLDESIASAWTDIALPGLSDTAPDIGVSGTAVGFGQRDPVSGNPLRTSGTLQVMDRVVFSGPDGSTEFEALLRVQPGNAANQMFCQPGNGGPLFVDGRVAGIAAFRNVATCAEDGPGYYMNVSRLGDWVRATLADLDGPPVLTLPADTTVPIPGPQAFTFTATATDAVDGPVPVTCSPVSGSVFPVGTTRVQCSATDSAGHTASGSFSITVRRRPLALVSPGDQISHEGDAISLPIVATNPDGPAPHFTATGLPPALTIDATSGLVAGTPSYTSAGVYHVTIAATDDVMTATQTFQWTVVNRNGPPTITGPGDQANYLGDNVTLPIAAVDPDQDPLTFTTGRSPASAPDQILGVPNLRVDRATGVITGRLSQPGVFTARVAVADATHPAVFATFTWTVIDHRRPTIRAIDDQFTAAGATVSLQVWATAGPGGGALTYQAAGLPAGLTIDRASGRITGTPLPVADGTPPATVTVTVRDTAGAAATVAFAWKILGTHETDLEVTVRERLLADGARVKITFTVSNRGPQPVLSAAPAIVHLTGLSAGSCSRSGPSSHAGMLQTADDTLEVWFAAGDSVSCQTTQPVLALPAMVVSVAAPPSLADYDLTNNIAVERALNQPAALVDAFSNPGNQANVEDDAVALQLPGSASDGRPLYFGIVAGSLPAGLALDSVTGLITGSLDPGSSGDYPITIAATGGVDVATQAFAWHVTTLRFVDPGSQNDPAGVYARLDLQVTDRLHQVLVTASGVPAGLFLGTSPDRRSWWIDGVPAVGAIGVHTVTLVATAGGASVTRTFTWAIGANVPPTLLNPGPQLTHGGQPVALQLHAAIDPFGDPIVFGVNPSKPLPPGLTLNATTGRITGTIPFGLEAVFPVEVTATVRAQTVAQTFVWTVKRNNPPVLVNPGPQNSIARTSVTLQLVGSDPDGGPFTYGVDPGQPLPLGLTLNTATGLITGQPTSLGINHTVGVWVEDPWGIRAAQTFSWAIHHPPSIQPIGDQVTAAGDRVDLRAHLTPGDAGDTLILSATGLPAGLSFHADGSITGRPDASGIGRPASAVTITVQESNGTAASVSFAWRIVGPTETDLEVLASAEETVVGYGLSRLTLTARVINHGPQPIRRVGPANQRAVLRTTVSAAFGAPVWSCTQGPNGAAAVPIAPGVFELALPAGGEVTCTAQSSARAPAALPDVTLTARTSVPASLTDFVPINNSATAQWPANPVR